MFELSEIVVDLLTGKKINFNKLDELVSLGAIKGFESGLHIINKKEIEALDTIPINVKPTEIKGRYYLDTSSQGYSKACFTLNNENDEKIFNRITDTLLPKQQGQNPRMMIVIHPFQVRHSPKATIQNIGAYQ